MRIVTIDFETYYAADYTLSKLTYEEYVNDERFQVIGVAAQVDGGSTAWFSGNKAQTKAWLDSFDLENSAVLAHNAPFDMTILALHFGIYPKVILDTLSMARAVHGTSVGNSLAKLTEHYGLGAKGLEVHDFKGFRREDFSAAQLAAYGKYCCNDVTLTYTLFHQLAPRFNKTEMKLIDMTIKMLTMPQLMADRYVLEQHLLDVRNKRDKLLDDLGVNIKALRSDKKFAELLRACDVEPPVKISPTTGKETYAFAKTDEAMKALEEHENVNVQLLAAARLGTKSSIEETRTERLIGIADRCNGALPIGLQYYGARTGRWSAYGSTNFQNIPRDSAIKKGVVAPPGHVIVGADLSNIELRVGLWFSGQHDKLELLQTGTDLYKDFASNVFDVPYDAVTKEQRFIGKTSSLALIYNTGAAKLRNAIKQGSGKDIGEDEAKRIVALYRSEYSKVAALWKQGAEVLTAIQDDYYMDFGHNRILPVQGAEGILLPSGLHLTYPNLRREYKEDSSGYEWKYDKTSKQVDRIYGAKVMQGSTQALARCVMGEGMVRTAKRYPVALTVHDAVYLVVPESQGEEALAYVIESITAAPAWLPGIVLGAEGGIGHSLKDV